MDHSVAVRAEADEIRPGIDGMSLIDGAQRQEQGETGWQADSVQVYKNAITKRRHHVYQP